MVLVPPVSNWLLFNLLFTVPIIVLWLIAVILRSR